ncbi:GNAT family N-acetyltransferase [Acanthopleuribacter pedis]|uniref:GNAT family N-acetyltransferase n=1 Tax=Acanthopleuribacter pedis TaxID=442870 RepID=A0A8J7Q2W3_9BACT|nr:GNAT family N-acetyltransferase [Acanthopleuribacter pedis]MBO1318240.1 GNAT family N-acetyltransferase [Acanthopleuribacter pedis]
MLQAVPLSRPIVGLMEGSPGEAELTILRHAMHTEPPPSGHPAALPITIAENLCEPSGHILGRFAAVSFWGWLQVIYHQTEAGPGRAENEQRLIAAVKETARRYGCHAVLSHCFTKADQDKLANAGFHRVGKLEGYPRGFAHRVMVWRNKGEPVRPGPTTVPERRSERNWIPQLLDRTLTARGLPPREEQPLNRVIRNRAGQPVAGVLGSVCWNQLTLNGLWTHPDYRGRGCAGRLLHSVEKAARRHKLDHILLDTFSFQALFFYQRRGYRVYATLRDFPTGHERHYLAKRL